MNLSHSRVTLILLVVVLFSGCRDDASNLSYKLKQRLIFCTPKRMSDKSGTFIYDEKSYLYTINDTSIIVIDIKEDSICNTVQLPLHKNFNSIDFVAPDNFVCHMDSSLFMYDNSKFTHYKIYDYAKDIVIIPYYGIRYFPSIKKVTFGFINRESTTNSRSYFRDFIGCLNLTDSSVIKINFKYPQQYHDNKLGIPKAYFSKSANSLIVSLSYDENIYKIDLNTSKIETILVRSSKHKLNLSYNHNGSVAEKRDKLLWNENHEDSYGIAFINSENGDILRIYKPTLPEQENDSTYLGSFETGCEIIKLNHNRTLKEYKLPRGVYFIPDYWCANNEMNELTYQTILPYDKEKKIWLFNIHTLHLYDFY